MRINPEAIKAKVNSNPKHINDAIGEWRRHYDKSQEWLYELRADFCDECFNPIWHEIFEVSKKLGRLYNIMERAAGIAQAEIEAFKLAESPATETSQVAPGGKTA